MAQPHQWFLRYTNPFFSQSHTLVQRVYKTPGSPWSTPLRFGSCAPLSTSVVHALPCGASVSSSTNSRLAFYQYSSIMSCSIFFDTPFPAGYVNTVDSPMRLRSLRLGVFFSFGQSFVLNSGRVTLMCLFEVLWSYITLLPSSTSISHSLMLRNIVHSQSAWRLD